MVKTSRKILIIDDEESIRDGCKQVLTHKGYHVDCAGDAVNGLQMGLRNSYDLLLLDVRMPRVSGMDILKKLKEKCISQSYYRHRFRDNTAGSRSNASRRIQLSHKAVFCC